MDILSVRLISPPPPVSSGRSLRTAMPFGKEFVGRFLDDSSFDSCIHAIRMFSSGEGKIIPAGSVGYHHS